MELLLRYSNRPELLKPLLDVLRRIEENDQTNEHGLDAGPPPQPGRLILDRLSQAEVMAVIDCYMAGMPRTKVAAKFNISDGTVKWILRKHGVRRRRASA